MMNVRNRLFGTGLALMCAASCWAQSTVLYQDSFDNDSLSANSGGVGGGANNTTIAGHSWTDDGDGSFVTSGTAASQRALFYSQNAFQSDTGFKLTVKFNTGSIGNTGAHNLSFGLVSADTNLSSYTGFNPFGNTTSVYSIGANVTSDLGAAKRGLNFTDGSTVTNLDQSGTNAQFKAGETCEVTLEIGIGSFWSYRIDGAYEASGVLLDENDHSEEIDLSKSYHVVVYGRDDNGAGKAIESITLEKRYAAGERAADLRGRWHGAETDIESVKNFMTLDSMIARISDGASLSAKHLAPSKLMEQVALDANIDYVAAPTWGDLSGDEPEADAFFDHVLAIKEAGFKVKAYTNGENFVGSNSSEYQPFVDAWMDYCDSELSDFIDSQPYHTGIWNRNTNRYEDATATYPYRKYMFCYAEYILKDHSLRYGDHFGAWIFDDSATMEQMGDNATSGLIEEQRIYQAYANAVHAGNPDIPVSFNNGRSTSSYDAFPYAHSVRFDDFTFGHAFGGNNDHASKTGTQFVNNYKYVQRMTATNGYVHDGGAWDWDDLIVGNFHSKLSTTSWKYGATQAWEQDDFNQWNLEAMQAGGHMTWGGSTPRTSPILYEWAYDLLKGLDDHLAQYQSPGAPNWARYSTPLPDGEAGENYSDILIEDYDFWDPEGNAVTLSLVGAPRWLKINAIGGGAWELSGVPVQLEAATYEFELKASDNSGSNTRKVELFITGSYGDPSSDDVLTGIVMQSSTAHSGAAERAIDGNTDGAWSAGTTTHTAAENQPWWQIDLGQEYDINEIVIWGRTDTCCNTRLSNYDVTILDSDMDPVWTNYQDSYPDPYVELSPTNATGQHVLIQLRGSGVALSLAEVEIFGTEPTAPAQRVVTIRKRNADGYAFDGGSGGADGQNVYLWSFNGNNANQQWIEIDRGNGYYSYQKAGTNFCLDGGAGGAKNQNVYLWTMDENNQNQHWQKVLVDGNYYRLVKRNAPDYCINGGSGGANAQNLALWTIANSQNLQWLIEDAL